MYIYMYIYIYIYICKFILYIYLHLFAIPFPLWFESTARSPVNFPQAQPKTTIANPTAERRCRENLKGLGKWGDPVGDP